MKKLLFSLFVILTFQLSAQTEKDSLFTASLFEYLDAGNVDEIIKLTDEKASLNNSQKYVRGIAFYYLEKDIEAIQLFDEVIADDPTSRGSRYYKSIIHFSKNELDLALSTINDAIKVDEKDPDYHLLKGEILYSQSKFEESVVSVRKALSLEKCRDRAYSVLAEIYYHQNDTEKALEVSLEGVKKIGADSPIYEDLYFNAGLMAHFLKKFDKTNEIYTELYKTHPTPAIASKLIQSYYALGEYEKGNALKPAIYKAWEAGEVEEIMKTEFCFDQFDWNDKTVMAFEQFNEKPGDLYYKHVFYVVDKEGRIAETIQTEYSPVMVELRKDRDEIYVLGRDTYSPEGGNRIGHSSYFQYVFAKEFDYAKLKKAVLSVLNEEDTASSSSTYGTPKVEATQSKKEKKKSKKKKKRKNKN